MKNTATHPPDAALEAFALGKLDSLASQPIEEHLADCEPCQEQVAAVPPDTLVEAVAAAPTWNESARSDAPTPTLDGLATPSLYAATQVWGGSTTSAANDAVPAALAGHPKYHAIRLLGTGGMGTVWLAQHAVMNRPVAVKVIRPDLLAKSGATGRFLREVRAAAKLHHANIVTAFDAEPVGDSCLLVMEFVDGETLAEQVKDAPLPVAEACRAIRDAACGLAHAHAAGLVHRDVKPHNLIRAADGTVKVLDFGLAGVGAGELIVAEGDGLTGAGMVVGTPDYIAPEQIADPRGADARADIYGLGCTFHHLLAGRSPIPDGSIVEKLKAQETRTPDPIPGLPRELAGVLAKMLAKRPEDRYQTADEVVEALDQCLRQADPRRRRNRRRFAVAAASLLFAVLLTAAGVVFKIQRDNEEITIATDDPDIEVVMKRKGEIVLIRDAKTGETWELDTIKNQIGLAEMPDGLKIDIPGKEPLILRRVGKEIFSVTRVPRPESAEIRRDALTGTNELAAHITQVAFSPEGRYFLAAGDAGCRSPMRIYNGKTGQSVCQLFPDEDTGWSGGVFNHDGSKVASWSDGGAALYIWESSTGRRLHKLEGHKASIASGAFSPDGTRILSSSQDHTLRVWDVASGKHLLILEGHTDDCGGCFSPDGKWIISTSGGDDNSIRGWDAATGKEVWKQTEQALVDFRPRIFSPDGTRLLSLWGSSIRVSEVATGKEISRLAGPTDLIGASFLSDGKQLVSWGHDKKLRVWDLVRGKEVRNLDLGADMETKPDQLVLSPDGRLLMTAHGQTVRIRDLETGRELRRYTIDAQEARRLAFSPDSAYAAAGSFRGWVYLWRLSDAELPGSPKGTFSLPTKAADGGDWSLTLDGKSKYTFQRNGAVAVEGTYKIAGDQIELTDESGPNRELGDKRTGTYRWKLAGASLLFTPVKDEGRGRMGVLVSGAWIALKKP